MTVPAQNPFADPIQPPSVYPSQSSLRGRLVLITPHKIETTPSNLNPGQMQERITADVTVVDGLGPVPDIKNNQHSGQWLEGPDFTGVWLSGQRVVDQLRSQIGTGQSVLGVIETYQPGQVPMKGNPWGILTATPEQKAQASQFLAQRTMAAVASPGQNVAPAPQQDQYRYDLSNDIDRQLLATQQQQAQGMPAAQPQYAQQAPTQANPPYPVPANQPPQYTTAPAMQQYTAPAPAQPQYPQTAAPTAPAPAAQPVAAPVQAPAPGAANTPAPGQAPAANPFLQNAPAPAQPVNPFLQNAPQQ